MDGDLLTREQLEEFVYRDPRQPEYTLNDALLATRLPLDNGRHPDIEPKCDAGDLNRLPMELVHQILASLDIPSLTSLRAVNRLTRRLVDSAPGYAVILEHCPDVLRAIVALQARHYDLRTLYETLHEAECEMCGARAMGHYLYLVTCRRVCYVCFTQHPVYYPMPMEEAVAATEFTVRQLEDRFPSVLSLPGKYTVCMNVETERHLLLDRRAVQDDVGDIVSKPGDLMMREPRRFMAVISAPYFSIGSGGRREASWGFYCRICKDYTPRSTLFKQKLTEDGFARHLAREHGLRQCKDGRRGIARIYRMRPMETFRYGPMR